MRIILIIIPIEHDKLTFTAMIGTMVKNSQGDQETFFPETFALFCIEFPPTLLPSVVI